MEKHLLPPRQFAVEPEAPIVAQSFAFWLRTGDFIVYLEEERREGECPVNKKRVVISACRSVSIPLWKMPTHMTA